MRPLSRLLGRGAAPARVADRLEADEHVVAVAPVDGGGELVATSVGLWLPGAEGAEGAEGAGRVGWHLVSKASWTGGTLTVVVADQVGTAGQAVLLADRTPLAFRLAQPGKLPEAVHARVAGSIRSRHHRDLPGGGAWFVQRKVPGRDGVVLQVRADPGTDPEIVEGVAREVAERLRRALPPA